jgi:hypothetical protein
MDYAIGAVIGTAIGYAIYHTYIEPALNLLFDRVERWLAGRV